jgi:CubicO group peptidase (beta-lactamase class C family)
LDGDTLFQIGSVTKVFTCLLLADATIRGEVALDQPASDLMPRGVRLHEPGRSITLRDLATHLSGLPAMPTNLDLRASPDPISAYTVDDLYAFLAAYDPPRAPGVAFEYSNLGVALLGHLLARRSGKDYEVLLRERILEPAGLSSTSVSPGAASLRRLATGHDRYLRPVDTWEMRAMPASGSLRSSANDLLTFLSIYFSGTETPLRAAAALQLAQPRPPVGPSQGLGLMVRRADGQTTFGFNGSKSGFMCFVGFDPLAKIGVVVLSNNHPDDSVDPLGLHFLTGRPLPAATPVAPAPARSIPIKRPAGESARFDGNYLGGNKRFVVAALGQRLLLQTWGDGVDEFFVGGEEFFYSRVNEDELRFQFDGTGSASSFILKSGGNEIRAIRAG